ncbi:MAG: magnesium transporter [Betaproteobacteria bacterium]|nr:magnesium transporter [Betaproteobacteria bacterium]
MREVNGLSTAFVEAHPADAARVLEGLGAVDTAAFVAALEPRLAAPILRHGGPPYCARIFESLEDSRVVELIQMMGPQAAAQIVQHLPAGRQMKLLSALPVGISIAIRLLIGYPRGTCGASMDPWPMALGAGMSAAEALEEVRKFRGDLGDCLFVSNGQRRLIGVVSLGSLLRCGPRQPLSAVMRVPEHVVSALASVSAVANNSGWDEFHVLPVVERENRLVGALHRHALTSALSGPAVRSAPNLVSGAFGAYWQTLSALAEIVVGTLPPVPSVASERKSDER